MFEIKSAVNARRWDCLGYPLKRKACALNSRSGSKKQNVPVARCFFQRSAGTMPAKLNDADLRVPRMPNSGPSFVLPQYKRP